MIFMKTCLDGAYVVEPELIEDERGYFARTWCQRKFEQAGLNAKLLQCNISFNRKTGTIRGMHYQTRPYEETKLVRCTAGAIYDVIVDLRPGSPSIAQWFAIELTAANHRMLVIPPGVAHGFQTLTDNCEVFYQMSMFYRPDSACGVRWNDPAFAIQWPLPVSMISEKDSAYPDFVVSKFN
jgi:dTDP-4-dehydrorhamnose 3,5-epimerase